MERLTLEESLRLAETIDRYYREDERFDNVIDGHMAEGIRVHFHKVSYVYSTVEDIRLEITYTHADKTVELGYHTERCNKSPAPITAAHICALKKCAKPESIDSQLAYEIGLTKARKLIRE